MLLLAEYLDLTKKFLHRSRCNATGSASDENMKSLKPKKRHFDSNDCGTNSKLCDFLL